MWSQFKLGEDSLRGLLCKKGANGWLCPGRNPGSVPEAVKKQNTNTQFLSFFCLARV